MFVENKQQKLSKRNGKLAIRAKTMHDFSTLKL